MKYLVISDTHSNLEALEAVIAEADHDKIVFLGDAVDYGPDPVAVVDILQEAAAEGGSMVQGNHDQGAATPEDQFDDSWWSPLASATMRYSRRMLRPPQLDFLRGLPLTAELDLGAGGRAMLCHGSPASNLEYLWPDMPTATLQKIVEEACRDFDWLFVGHSHLPFVRPLGKLRLANPGSVGQPRDGDPRAAYAMFDTAEGKLTFHRVAYALETTAAKLRDRGVPHAERLALILRTGGG